MKRKKTKPANQPPTAGNLPENEKARRWLWIGVASFTAVIIGIWLWSFKTGMSQVRWNQTSESQLIKSGYNQINDIIDKESIQLRQEYYKTQLKRIVGEIIAETNAGSSTGSIKAGIAAASATTTTSSSPASSTANQTKK
jgi:hypothetical protein